MGSIFASSQAGQRFHTKRQQQYFQGKKTDRKVVKKEQAEQIELCKWMRQVLPCTVHFRSDTGSGAFNSQHEKDTHNKQQSSDKQPDIVVFAARRGYYGLAIELKATDTELRMKRDGRKLQVRKDKKGRVLEQDYKIRKKGDWKNLHIERQHKVIVDYRAEGYCAVFAIGLEQAKKLVSWYFDIPYVEPIELF